MDQIWSKICIFWSFWAKYCHFLHILSNARPKTNVNKVPRWFSVMWVTNFYFSSKKRIFCPKTTKFGPKLAFLVNLGQAMQAYSMPCWWVGWWLWRAGCISQDTYLLYSKLFNWRIARHVRRYVPYSCAIVSQSVIPDHFFLQSDYGFCKMIWYDKLQNKVFNEAEWKEL